MVWVKTLHVNSTAGDYQIAPEQALLMTFQLELCSAQENELQLQNTCELSAWELVQS